MELQVSYILWFFSPKLPIHKPVSKRALGGEAPLLRPRSLVMEGCMRQAPRARICQRNEMRVRSIPWLGFRCKEYSGHAHERGGTLGGLAAARQRLAWCLKRICVLRDFPIPQPSRRRSGKTCYWDTDHTVRDFMLVFKAAYSPVSQSYSLSTYLQSVLLQLPSVN